MSAALPLQDKISAFWEISKKDLEDKKAELLNKDREMEEMEERHQVEIKVTSSQAGPAPAEAVAGAAAHHPVQMGCTCAGPLLQSGNLLQG